MSKDSFDPRFDPAFQPGFDGAVVSAPTRKAKDAAPAQAALEQRSEAAERVVTSSPDDEVVTEHRRRPNPFLLALLAVSFALIAGGLGAAQSVSALFDTENISLELDYVSLEMVKIAAPLSVALGVATAIGVLFIYAVDWKKRHES